ncbi:kinesin-like protein KIF22 [Dreissena polymorpha]|uniref:Kinesin-like protein n=1 Tax=Dreissena polymorpha TaxID=45954 RepID=A0A9D4MUM7_DREPO|nr:kinesin-like protein KIF22 [Dreissena polymorpha]XP_052212684.1 kinesin-like protein KIF22 [Dreissena polymorpha]XP_052212692.1 kinesin-like protein KIF22 [Dreissena polymorpha]XP_052212699.1 kinesin-like protein KIF22 [Dreissena polymorpha]XP_052212707.1 kinesin-like protein KIF22 [Dreissena polymorpha]XP_052212716.1 kinesin-like protein KIF22 [Dreissena polymorpha]XP_052212720.1 kinesin-like protein KIF22 [Dreissena polymorpha]XP_052212726.1 kinesin-like protein KIF22 [Dreissena polymor
MEKKQCKVKVVIRVRPPLVSTEKISVSTKDNHVQIFNHRNINENLQYEFSAVYGSESTQQQIFNDCVKPLLPKALSGQNVSIFAYGPTGAGKTHTMLGTPLNPGVIPRVINELFAEIDRLENSEDNEWEYSVSFSYLEIYQEKVQDLLEPSGSDLPIREDAEKNILVPGLAKKQIHNFDEFKNIFGPASNNRTVAATKLNEHSSRSHSIVQLTVVKKKPCRILHGKIYLIDLAGSEDNRRTGNQGIRLKESGAINKSLFSLGEVVDAINNGLPRIPYRNSKLTRLLQDSIGGTCHSVMITNLAPEERYYYDTYCTLNFATKSKKVVNSTVVRETVGIVKPVPQVRKPSPERKEEGPSQAKLARLDSSTDSMGSDIGSSISPLIKRQEAWEETVNRRLQQMESNLITQMQAFKPPTASGSCAQTPKTKAINELRRQLEENQAQFRELASRHLISPPPNASNKPFADMTNTKPSSTGPQSNLGETTQTEQTSKPGETTKPAAGTKRKRKMTEEFSCSPLFALPPRLKKKGFVSSASASSLHDVKENVTDKKGSHSKEDDLVNSASQLQRNEEFLSTLNTSSVKDLQSLQTVGAKRAKLIFEWRETYGAFTQASDLLKIPGFTEKYLQKLLHSNLVTV